MLTLEKQRVVIDWFVRWRITDPLQYIRNVGLDEAAGANQLNRVVRNAFQEEINRRTVRELLAGKREQLMTDFKREVLEAYNRSLQQDLAKSVWAATGASWYKLADGTITNNWPHSTIRYQRLLRAANLEDFDT